MMRKCDLCGASYVAQRSSSRFCSPRCRSRNGGAPRQRHVVLSVTSDATDGDGGASLLDAVRSELAAADMTNSALGQLALLLAGKLSDPHDTAAGIAAVSKELSRVMTAALRGVHVSTDPLDELQKRRHVKRSQQ
jgi:endogenous inhibitor of DNA gyrase (YacG/DUF329 family)